MTIIKFTRTYRQIKSHNSHPPSLPVLVLHQGGHDLSDEGAVAAARHELPPVLAGHHLLDVDLDEVDDHAPGGALVPHVQVHLHEGAQGGGGRELPGRFG